MSARHQLRKTGWYEDRAGNWQNHGQREGWLKQPGFRDRYMKGLSHDQLHYLDKLYDLRIEAITNRHGHVPDETLRGTGKKGDPTAGQLAHTANFAVEYKKGQADAWQMRKDGCSVERIRPPRGGTDAYLQGWKDFIGGV